MILDDLSMLGDATRVRILRLVECEELYEGEKAWRIEHRAPEAARARAAIEAAGEDSESGEEREMQFD